MFFGNISNARLPFPKKCDFKSLAAVLANNQFIFERFEKRDGTWDRANRCGKILTIYVIIGSCFTILLFLPCLMMAAKSKDKVNICICSYRTNNDHK